MSPRNLAPSEYGWEMLRRAETRKPHAAEPMFSSSSRGPINTFICGACSRYEYVYGSCVTAPVCYGGLPQMPSVVSAALLDQRR